MNKNQIKVGMKVVYKGRQCEVVRIIELPRGEFLVEVEANGEKHKVAGVNLKPVPQ